MPSDTYLVPDLKKGEIHRTELVVKKSRFITSIARTKGVDEAKAFIAKVTEEFSDARHNCFAYNADKPGTSGYAGCCDDGEPHGTAGQPMLNVLLHSGVGQITVVVTRYFGGILLGTGGLVKAYQDSIKQALDTLEIEDMVLTQEYKLVCDHKDVTLAQRCFSALAIKILSQDYTDKVTYTLDVPLSSVEQFTAQLTKITQGKALIEKID